MPRRAGRHYVLVKGAEDAMTAFKMEIAEDLGLADKIDTDRSFKNFTTVEAGQIGGEMMRRITAAGQYAIKQRYDNHESRLLPPEALPDQKAVREITNNGNPTLHTMNSVDFAPSSGQQGISTDRLH